MRRVAEGLYQIALTLWVGGLWVVGYVVAPVLFASLAERQLAGMLAGKLFAIIGWIGLAAAVYLLVFMLIRQGGRSFRSPLLWLVLLMALMAAAQLFGIQPLMDQLKLEALPREVMESVLRDRFAAWHGISSILYLLQSMLGACLVVWSARGLK